MPVSPRINHRRHRPRRTAPDYLSALRDRNDLSVETMRDIRQNLAFAFRSNSAGAPIAAGVLYPVFGILLSPMIGAAAIALSPLSVIGNALRLARTELDQDATSDLCQRWHRVMTARNMPMKSSRSGGLYPVAPAFARQ